MGINYIKLTSLVISSLMWVSLLGNANDKVTQQEIEVSLRMIGHQILLNYGDSTSRVLPIKKIEDRYRIPFSAEFGFDPTGFVATIDSVITATKMANSYLVEVEACDSKDYVYSYKSGFKPSSDVIPCTGRDVPKGCYSLLVTILDGTQDVVLTKDSLATNNLFGLGSSKTNSIGSIIMLLSLLLLSALGFYFWKKRKTKTTNSNIIPIGSYQFDKRNMKLSYKNSKIELTSKEADLLSLLHASANETLEREQILKVVWGGEGHYVGRTLDVFISKLRKKLEADPSIKITNIRGIGYKLVLNEAK